jgi:hypothetical protein
MQKANKPALDVARGNADVRIGNQIARRRWHRGQCYYNCGLRKVRS